MPKIPKSKDSFFVFDPRPLAMFARDWFLPPARQARTMPCLGSGCDRFTFASQEGEDEMAQVCRVNQNDRYSSRLHEERNAE